MFCFPALFITCQRPLADPIELVTIPRWSTYLYTSVSILSTPHDVRSRPTPRRQQLLNCSSTGGSRLDIRLLQRPPTAKPFITRSSNAATTSTTSGGTTLDPSFVSRIPQQLANRILFASSTSFYRRLINIATPTSTTG